MGSLATTTSGSVVKLTFLAVSVKLTSVSSSSSGMAGLV